MNTKTKSQILSLVREEIEAAESRRLRPRIKIHVFPGGDMPKRMSDGAIAYDVRLCRIVDAWKMERGRTHLRKTLCDFRGTVHPSVLGCVERRKAEPGWKRARTVYRLDPGAMAICDIGFATEMDFPLCYLTLCRSGIASKYHIVVANGPGTIDPDYRGAAGIILFNCGDKPFYLYRRMRIAQIMFSYAIMPRFTRARKYRNLGKTRRGADGFGSTKFH